MPPARLMLLPGLSTLTPDDEPLQAATAELVMDLREVDGLRATEESTPVVGHKGQWTELVIALGGPSVVAGAVTAMRLWLSRDRRRSLTLTAWRADEHPLRIEISGDNIAESTVREAVQRLLVETGPGLGAAPEEGPDAGPDRSAPPAITP
ncbi:effector-associated constant component EACC1 [Micromonospora sp. RP3T]|uniref:effector-associated constant component EACC1 n=1 Tax=Micromonospora sp. RP3T TaxID=2135446 RepID=UPI003D7631C5